MYTFCWPLDRCAPHLFFSAIRKRTMTQTDKQSTCTEKYGVVFFVFFLSALPCFNLFVRYVCSHRRCMSLIEMTKAIDCYWIPRSTEKSPRCLRLQKRNKSQWYFFPISMFIPIIMIIIIIIIIMYLPNMSSNCSQFTNYIIGSLYSNTFNFIYFFKCFD